MNRILFAQLLIVLLCFQVGVAQNGSISKPETINEKFEKLLKESNNYEDYKVIKKHKIYQLRENTQKHIEGLNSQISTLGGTINTLNTEITTLKASLNNTKTTLKGINKEKDSINFFGTLMSKAGYNTMVWSIVTILLLGLLFFIFKFKNSNILTKQAKKKLEEVENSFESYKHKALEKEQKLGRQLQDERNKSPKKTKR